MAESRPVALITGASGGIGEATARLAAARGWAVILVARRASPLEVIAQSITASGGQAIALPCDLRQTDSLSALMERALAAFGRLDALVNNAALPAPMGYRHVAADLIGDQLLVNLVAPAVLARLALPALEARHGCVVNVGSLARHFGPVSLYQLSKAGLADLSVLMRRELAPAGVSVCHLDLGAVATNRITGARGMMRRLAVPPEKVAATIVELWRHPRAYVALPFWAAGLSVIMRVLFGLAPGWAATYSRAQVRRHGATLRNDS